MPTPPPTAPSPSWASIPQLIASMRAGGPAERGLEVAAALVDLGLQEPAAAWAQAVAPAIAASPGAAPKLVAVAQRLESLAPSAVDPESLIRAAHDALDALPDLAPQLAPHLVSWAARVRAAAWFRTNCGQLIGLRADRDLLDPEWFLRFNDHHSAARLLELPPNTPRSTGFPAPAVLGGLASGEQLERLQAHFEPLDFGARARILVVEPDPGAALDALASGARPGSDGRTQFFLGPSAIQDLDDWLAEHDGQWSSLSYTPSVPGWSHGQAIAEKLHTLVQQQGETVEKLIAANNSRAASRNSGGTTPRLLVLTTRLSTYLQHAAADIVAAAKAGGAQAELLIEPDDCSELNGIAIARTISRFNPDAVLLINYTRSHLGRLIPEELPVVTWIQDAMPHLYRDETGASVKPHDLVVGTVFKELVTEHGYDHTRCIRFGVPASVAKFGRGEPLPLRCEIMAATNYGEPPEAMASRLASESRARGAPEGIAEAVCSQTRDAVEHWNAGYLAWALEDAVAKALLSCDLSPESSAASRLMRDIAYPYANRLLRYRAIRWAAELAREEGIRFHLYGSGWEDNSEFAPFAKGVLEHGSELRDAYATAGVTLHAGAHWIAHQRLYECALAGGLPATLLRPEDTDAALRPALYELMQRDETPTACRVEDKTHCIQATESGLAALCLRNAQRMNTMLGRWEGAEAFRPQLATDTGLIPIGAGDLRTELKIEETEAKIDHARLVDAMHEQFFTSKDQLLTIVRNASDGSSWRTDRSQRIAAIAERAFSYESAVSAILERLAAENAAAHANESNAEQIAA